MSEYQQLANAIRALSMDGVQKAKSGHPGAPLGMADMAEALWRGFLHHNPKNPHWANRDRFVLSNGHASMLIYSLLHLTGYDLSIDDIKNFRQLDSKTPGHPEYGDVPGVETTTGPLGQGLANAVGFAMAEQMLAAEFNRDGMNIVDHYTYVFMGDGCLMEGISHEACSFAGTLGLGKLIALYDSNGISIDGEVKNWFADDTAKRFESYHWHVQEVDGHDGEAIRKAIEAAKAETARPSLIICNTTIGKGSPNKQGKESSHGAPLGDDEIALTRKAIGWDHPPFVIPEDIYAKWSAVESGARLEQEWNDLFARYKAAYPEMASEFERRMSGELPCDLKEKAMAWAKDLQANPASIATRKAGQNALDFFGALLPELAGGSADLAPSNLTMNKASRSLLPHAIQGNYVHWGVREFLMCAAMNGMMLHGGFRPYGGTFLIFSEYARNAIRMSALMKIPTLFVFTHDSIGVGEDGPTHEPIEQTATLRLVPNLDTWRPCDQVETAVAWTVMVERRCGPSNVILSRQNLEQLPRTDAQIADIAKGGYILKDCDGTPDLIYIATGSEVSLAFHAAEELAREGKKVRVVSMPCCEVFDRQSPEYREQVLPSAVRNRVAVEAGSTTTWYKYVGMDGKVLGIDHYGASAPAAELFKRYGFTVENTVAFGKSLLNK
ncbi:MULTISPECIES: transketolase [unclassified Anaerobiospirillum]|uniref:transketolase n=1 Tax=unclassified Anaerobiospirillum TaxID=2647410 RepID=UPI001FF474BC|nr:MULTISPECIES: transketolase [unclassified Anaerobiospirillum]MCK0535196.1 transketolase [Anaerobiospirillum sp. NML120511]MCK0540282.1 transketolase [Anaerobiospirillum sp. NML02-A-032]